MPDDPSSKDKPFDFRARLGRFIVPPFVHDPKMRKEKWDLPDNDDEPGDYIVELNLAYYEGLQQAGVQFRQMYQAVLGEAAAKQRPPVYISKSYYKCSISAKELRELVQQDENKPDARHRLIYKVWPDFPVEALIDRSTTTVKADAAIRAFEATGSEITWAVIDSGIDGKHIHFGPGADGTGPNKFCNTLFHASVATLHRDFTVGGIPEPSDFPNDPAGFQAALQKNIQSALNDEYGHGTHVAAIIAGGLDSTLKPDADFAVRERVFKADPGGQSHSVSVQPRTAKASPCTP